MASEEKDAPKRPSGPCNHCHKTATNRCSGCSSAPPYDEDCSKRVFYCNAKCQKANWAQHKIECESLQPRKLLSRAAMLLKETMVQIRLNAYPVAADYAHIEGETIILKCDRLDQISLALKPFQINMEALPDFREAVLLHCACSEAIMYLYKLAEGLFDGLCTNIEELNLMAINQKLRIAHQLPNGSFFMSKQCVHDVYRIMLRNGELWVIDITGAQYGYPEVLLPWTDYERDRVEKINVQATLGHMRNTLAQHLRQSSFGPLVAARLQKDSLTKALDEQILQWSKEYGGKLSSMLRGSDATFQATRQKFSEQVNDLISTAIANMYSHQEVNLRANQLSTQLSQNLLLPNTNVYTPEMFLKAAEGMVFASSSGSITPGPSNESRESIDAVHNGDPFENSVENITAHNPLQILASTIPGAGTGLFTTNDVPADVEIFRSDPLVNCVADELHSIICDYCFVSSKGRVLPDGEFRREGDKVPNVNACVICKLCSYCSKACQRKAWKSYHKYECKVLTSMPKATARTRILCRTLIKHKFKLLNPQEWQAMDLLKSHQAEHLLTQWSHHITTAAEAVTACTKTGIGERNVLDLYCKILTNCMCIHPAEGGTTGTTLDLVSSFINHSCEPNVFVLFEGSQLRAHSLRPLVAGDEITQCYADTTMDVLLRRKTLKSEYFFDCNCGRCCRELEELNARVLKENIRLEIFEKTQQQLIQFVNQVTTEQIKSQAPFDVELFEEDVKFIARQAFPQTGWPDDIPPMPYIMMNFARICKAQNKNLDAIKYGLNGLLSQTRRSGQNWVNELFEVLLLLAPLVTQPKDSSVFKNKEQLQSRDIWDLHHGLLQELTLAACKTFGLDTQYTSAILTWYSDALESADKPYPGTPGFAERFYAAQERLLAWADLGGKKGIELT